MAELFVRVFYNRPATWPVRVGWFGRGRKGIDSMGVRAWRWSVILERGRFGIWRPWRGA